MKTSRRLTLGLLLQCICVCSYADNINVIFFNFIDDQSALAVEHAALDEYKSSSSKAKVLLKRAGYRVLDVSQLPVVLEIDQTTVTLTNRDFFSEIGAIYIKPSGDLKFDYGVKSENEWLLQAKHFIPK